MNAAQFDRFILRPVLAALAPEIPNGEAARRLLLGTAAHESGGFRWIDQKTSGPEDYPGPAYGYFQMEAPTHDDLWASFLQFRPFLAVKVRVFRAPEPDPVRQLYNPFYAAACARAQYFRARPALPPADDLPALAAYWKDHWCRGCAGTVEEWLQHYPRGL